MRKTTKITAVIGGGALVVATAGAAYAYWSTSGSGEGSASTTAGIVDKLTFTQNPAGTPDTPVAVAPMYPGDSSQTLSVRVRNTGSESTYVSSVKAYITTDKPGCTGADFKLGGVAAPSTSATAAALTWTAQDLAANAAAVATSTIQFNNTGSLQDVCKGAAVVIHYVAS